MAYYINPPTLTKEAWLKEHGTPINLPPKTWAEVPDDSLLVCLVDTSMFTSAYIVYDESEFELMNRPSRKEKEWYLVSKEKILQVEPSIAHLVKLPKKEQQ